MRQTSGALAFLRCAGFTIEGLLDLLIRRFDVHEVCGDGFSLVSRWEFVVVVENYLLRLWWNLLGFFLGLLDALENGLVAWIMELAFCVPYPCCNRRDLVEGSCSVQYCLSAVLESQWCYLTGW